jgi:hypothetical protein
MIRISNATRPPEARINTPLRHSGDEGNDGAVNEGDVDGDDEEDVVDAARDRLTE